MKKSASLVAETVDLLGEVLGEAKVIYGGEAYFVPDDIVASVIKGQEKWSERRTAIARKSDPSAPEVTPRVKKAVLPPSLASSFSGMESEVQRDLAVIYYENQKTLDAFIAKRSVFPGAGSGSWTDNSGGLTQDIIDQIYVLETKGRSDVVGKGEALALLYWDGGTAAAGSSSSTATIDLVLSGKEVSVKAYEGLNVVSEDIRLDFKVNGTLSSFKDIAEARLKEKNPGAHKAFSSIWSKNINQEVIFTAALESRATQEQFKALVESLDYGIREMKGSGSTGDYIYLVVSRNGWLVIDKKSPDLNFGGITEGKVSVNYRRVTDLRTAADGSPANFNNMVKAKTSPIAKAENALLTAYNSLEGMGSIDDTTNIADLKKRIKSVGTKLEAYKAILGSDKEAQAMRPGVLASINSDNNRLVKSIKGALAALQSYREKTKDNARVGYEVAMRPLFGSANMLNWPSPGSDAVQEIDGFIENVLLARSVDSMSESRRRKPRRSETSMGGVLGSQVPMGRGPDGKPDRRTSNAILRKNGMTQARYFGGGSIVEETRELLLDLLDD